MSGPSAVASSRRIDTLTFPRPDSSERGKRDCYKGIIPRRIPEFFRTSGFPGDDRERFPGDLPGCLILQEGKPFLFISGKEQK